MYQWWGGRNFPSCCHIFEHIFLLLTSNLQHRNNILYMVESFQTVVILGETGSGKSTQIPQVNSSTSALSTRPDLWWHVLCVMCWRGEGKCAFVQFLIFLSPWCRTLITLSSVLQCQAVCNGLVCVCVFSVPPGGRMGRRGEGNRRDSASESRRYIGVYRFCDLIHSKWFMSWKCTKGTSGCFESVCVREMM